MILLQVTDPDTTGNAFELFNKLSPKFFMRLAVDVSTIFILIRFIYLPIHRNREYIFTFFIFNLIIFLITFLLNKVEMSMGAAFGLFAVFSMLRYRTEDISIKDMTYLFLTIAIGLISAVSKGSWDELSLLSIIILLLTWLLESKALMKREEARIILYEKIELIKPECRDELRADLENRLGVKIHHIAIGKVDFLRDSAIIHVYYYE